MPSRTAVTKKKFYNRFFECLLLFVKVTREWCYITRYTIQNDGIAEGTICVRFPTNYVSFREES